MKKQLSLHSLRKELNEPQYQAVTHTQGPLLIIAGAGSGKTRVITYRIAYMLQQGILPEHILALTFTNKAALEMKGRVEDLMGHSLKSLQISTFHSFGLHLLRLYGKHLGYRPRFTIYDTYDKAALLNEIAQEQRYALENADLTNLAYEISAIKDGRRDVRTLEEWQQRFVSLYQERLLLYNAADFDDLITQSIKLLEKFPDVLQRVTQRWRTVLVDEFQDTSLSQYALLQCLASQSGNLCCVGDDDQSIYSWRGAHYDNLIRLEKDFPRLKEIKLEQNYRSTQLILQAANAVIAHNGQRKDKTLWSGQDSGKALALFHPRDEQDEAQFIARTLKRLVMRENLPYSQTAILVRTNSLFRHFEQALRQENIPHTLSGGESFFQKKEVKDVLAYLKVVLNPDDDAHFLRILNVPKRGLGQESLKKLDELCRQEKNPSVYGVVRSLVYQAQESPFSTKTHQALSELLVLLDEYHHRFLQHQESFSSLLESLLEDLDYRTHLEKETSTQAWADFKMSNVDRFVDMLKSWERVERDEKDLSFFLQALSLQNNEDPQDSKEALSLMTIHASKGLEFSLVFIAGVEDGLIPHHKSVTLTQIEEERRLFYVALTRAKDRVILTAVEKRKRSGSSEHKTKPSPFLAEIPSELLENILPEDEEELTPETADAFLEEFKRKIATQSKI